MPQPPPIPEKIGRYPVLRVLGAGAMGCVYLARDTELDRDVAIKTVRVQDGADAEGFSVRFRNEARAVGRLRHRSIVAVYDVGTDPELGPYLVMEYVEGPTLKEILRTRGPLSPAQMVALAEQVGEALAAAHAEGIIHRDLKPDNLLVGKDGVVRLADFGVARVPDAALTGKGQFLGTPCYGAPETLRGREADPLSEQFSFGAVLYEAASGARAFPGADALAVAHAVIHDQPEPPSQAAVSGASLPKAVDEVIMRALSKDREARFASLSELVEALRLAYAQDRVAFGSLSSTVPLTPNAKKAKAAPPAGGPSVGRLWPLFAFALALGAFFALLVGRKPTRSEPGESVADASFRAPESFPQTEPPLDDPEALPEGVLAEGADAALPDTEGGDAGVGLSPFEREERAKDALERARRALSAGDREAADAALQEAARLDPEHPDIPSLRRALEH